MRANSVARRYAQATFEVSREKGESERWLTQLESVAEATSTPDLAETLKSPNLSDDQKARAIDTVFPDLPVELKNLVRLLIGRNRVDILPGICTAYREYLDELMGRIDAQITTARPLGIEELQAVQDHLCRRTGRTVTVKPSVDESLIGGIVMRIGDEVIDASIATRLERLRQRLV